MPPQVHAPKPITVIKVLPNGVRVTASADGRLNVWTNDNLLQYKRHLG